MAGKPWKEFSDGDREYAHEIAAAGRAAGLEALATIVIQDLPEWLEAVEWRERKMDGTDLGAVVWHILTTCKLDPLDNDDRAKILEMNAAGWTFDSDDFSVRGFRPDARDLFARLYSLRLRRMMNPSLETLARSLGINVGNRPRRPVLIAELEDHLMASHVSGGQDIPPATG